MPRRTALGKVMSLVVTEQTTELILPSRIESVAEAAAEAARIVSRAGFGEEVAFGVDMAVREAVTNAVLHGNRQDETKSVEISFTVAPEGLQITVRDRGEGFDPESVPDPTDQENVLKTSGRGIFFMRTFMDEVSWSRHPEGGTVVRMTKKR
jgi:serine/threonine-protein kinase RsbW